MPRSDRSLDSAQPVKSTHGLLSTVCYKLGPNAPVTYALEARAHERTLDASSTHPRRILDASSTHPRRTLAVFLSAGIQRMQSERRTASAMRSDGTAAPEPCSDSAVSTRATARPQRLCRCHAPCVDPHRRGCFHPLLRQPRPLRTRAGRDRWRWRGARSCGCATTWR
eukprot:6196659-Pleurochrysis_carterae.AAC.3